MEPTALDPLGSYFRSGTFLGGGLMTWHALDATSFTAEAELNEWRSPGPGRYRVYAVSYRVWRLSGSRDPANSGHVTETVRSNAVELQVNPASAEWQSEQLRSAMEILAGSCSSDEARQAARRLRFLNTKDSIKQLAMVFFGLNQEQATGWDLMFGLYGSPYRQLAIDSMHAELAAPGHPTTSEFLDALVNLQISADPKWDPVPYDAAHPEAAQEFWKREQTHRQELTKAKMQSAIESNLKYNWYRLDLRQAICERRASWKNASSEKATWKFLPLVSAAWD